jgi:predicted nucleic acid-binding protein
LLELAIQHNISVYDACYLREAIVEHLPLATNDRDLRDAAESDGITVMIP